MLKLNPESLRINPEIQRSQDLKTSSPFLWTQTRQTWPVHQVKGSVSMALARLVPPLLLLGEVLLIEHPEAWVFLLITGNCSHSVISRILSGRGLMHQGSCLLVLIMNERNPGSRWCQYEPWLHTRLRSHNLTFRRNQAMFSRFGLPIVPGVAQPGSHQIPSAAPQHQHLPFLDQLGFISLFSSFNTSLQISGGKVLTAS